MKREGKKLRVLRDGHPKGVDMTSEKRRATRLLHVCCVYPECPNSRRTRGLCHQHYQTMRSYVRDGRATEADLMRRGLLMEKGTGGASCNGHEAFKLGSKVKGTLHVRG
jgi:hypothetical protein